MPEITEVRYHTQFCLNGYEIGGNLYAEDAADMVRFWEDDFCLVEMSRKADGDLWEPTGGDSAGWTDLADEYASPMEALRELLPATEYALIEADE